jgi:hypothetical protein
MAEEVFGTANLVGQRAQCHIFVKMVHTFAAQHLQAAALFARQAWKIENEHQEQPFGSFFGDLCGYVSGAIMSATAALEANINELFIVRGPELRTALSQPETLSSFDVRFWGMKGIEKETILDKYKYALKILGKKNTSKNASHYDSAHCLIEMRNSLVHFKPLLDVKRRQTSLIEKLKSKGFALNPNLNDSEDDFISTRCMSHGCAEWAVKTVIEFVDDFSNVSGLPNTFHPFLSMLQTRTPTSASTPLPTT